MPDLRDLQGAWEAGAAWAREEIAEYLETSIRMYPISAELLRQIVTNIREMSLKPVQDVPPG